jgi:hypothetical protein
MLRSAIQEIQSDSHILTLVGYVRVAALFFTLLLLPLGNNNIAWKKRINKESGLTLSRLSFINF